MDDSRFTVPLAGLASDPSFLDQEMQVRVVAREHGRSPSAFVSLTDELVFWLASAPDADRHGDVVVCGLDAICSESGSVQLLQLCIGTRTLILHANSGALDSRSLKNLLTSALLPSSTASADKTKSRTPILFVGPGLARTALALFNTDTSGAGKLAGPGAGLPLHHALDVTPILSAELLRKRAVKSASGAADEEVSFGDDPGGYLIESDAAAGAAASSLTAAASGGMQYGRGQLWQAFTDGARWLPDSGTSNSLSCIASSRRLLDSAAINAWVARGLGVIALRSLGDRIQLIPSCVPPPASSANPASLPAPPSAGGRVRPFSLRVLQAAGALAFAAGAGGKAESAAFGVPVIETAGSDGSSSSSSSGGAGSSGAAGTKASFKSSAAGGKGGAGGTAAGASLGLGLAGALLKLMRESEALGAASRVAHSIPLSRVYVPAATAARGAALTSTVARAGAGRASARENDGHDDHDDDDADNPSNHEDDIDPTSHASHLSDGDGAGAEAGAGNVSAGNLLAIEMVTARSAFLRRGAMLMWRIHHQSDGGISTDVNDASAATCVLARVVSTHGGRHVLLSCTQGQDIVHAWSVGGSARVTLHTVGASARDAASASFAAAASADDAAALARRALISLVHASDAYAFWQGLPADLPAARAVLLALTTSANPAKAAAAAAAAASSLVTAAAYRIASAIGPGAALQWALTVCMRGSVSHSSSSAASSSAVMGGAGGGRSQSSSSSSSTSAMASLSVGLPIRERHFRVLGRLNERQQAALVAAHEADFRLTAVRTPPGTGAFLSFHACMRTIYACSVGRAYFRLALAVSPGRAAAG